MNVSETLANRLNEVICNGRWIANTNYKKELEEIDWKTATTSVHNLNTIALLAQHIHYIKGILQVFKGGTLEIKDQYSFDFPQITSEEQWHEFIYSFLNDTEKFVNHIKYFSNEKLYQTFEKPEYGNYLRNIEGIIDHSYYHLGQIVLIKKILSQQ